MKRTFLCLGWGTVIVGLIAGIAGCQALREVANLRQVQFRIDRITNTRLAGIPAERLQSYEELTASEVLRLTQTAATGEMPLTFTLFVEAENPAANDVQARLVAMDWMLLLDGRETVSGRLEENRVLPPGEVAVIPVPVRLDLVRFFGDNVRDLVDLALAVAGEDDPKAVALQVQPTIDTVIGPIEYPRPITVVREDVGAAPARN